MFIEIRDHQKPERSETKAPRKYVVILAQRSGPQLKTEFVQKIAILREQLNPIVTTIGHCYLVS